MNSYLNPYEFLGVNINSSLTTLKNIYYELALICHPDRGGKKEDMIILNNCYSYVKNQLENKKYENISDSYLHLEDEFKDFCQKQEEIIPSFSQIFEETNEFVKEFNRKFDESLNFNESNFDKPFTEGYQNFMENSNLENNPDIPHLNEIKYPISDCEPPLKTIHQKSVIVYQEPTSLPDNYGNFQHLNNLKINDFSYDSQTLQMTDYKMAFVDSDKNTDYYQNLGISKKTFDEITNRSNNLEDVIDQRRKDATDYLNYKQSLPDQSKI